MIKKCVMVLGIMACATSAWALGPLAVGDADFEMQNVGGGIEFDLSGTPWFRTVQAGGNFYTYAGVADFGGLGWVPGGAGVNQAGFAAFYPQSSLHQELGDVYLADTMYRFEVDVVAPHTRPQNVTSVELAFDWGTVAPVDESNVAQLEAARATVNQIAFTSISDPLLLPDAGTPVRRVGLTHYVPAGASYIGQPIQISMGGGPVPGLDNVTVGIIPEPATMALLGLGGLGLLLRRRRA